ncbi:hypothetical protein V6N13_043937 [Hibiscus sabdariffa]
MGLTLSLGFKIGLYGLFLQGSRVDGTQISLILYFTRQKLMSGYDDLSQGVVFRAVHLCQANGPKHVLLWISIPWLSSQHHVPSRPCRYVQPTANGVLESKSKALAPPV